MKLNFPKQDNDSFVERIMKTLSNIKLPSFDTLSTSANTGDGSFKEWFTFKRIVAIGAAVVFILIVIATSTFFSNLNTNEISDELKGQRVHFKVISGMDAAVIADRLKQKGVIDSTFKFRMLAKLNGYEDKLKIGSYTFTTGMKYDEIFTKLLAGEKEVIDFTIPEGFTVKDIAKRLDEIGLAEKNDFLSKAKTFVPYDYVEKNENAFYYCEGFLFPDTYTVENDVSIDELLKMMAEDFDYRLTKSMRARAAEQNLSIYELITLASIVEKEVRYAEDRPIVAQVFFKRLKLGMPLQTDASLQYLMDAPKEDVTIADTQIESPYNTYQHTGLTPGPIANPGVDAIEAVLYPADTDYLYFVADRSGHNYYSNSYDEHLTLVNQYR